jgi:hypothetical protein
MANWTVPLFLFVSHANRDLALLAHPPNRTLGTDYTPLSTEPVGYAHAVDATRPPSHPLVTLRAYWSASRRDILTTTAPLDEVNRDGGGYAPLHTVALVAIALDAGHEAAGFAPLRLAYDPVREDAASAPLSGADLNRLVTGAIYPPAPAIGFVRQARCEFCNLSMSEAFPSAGGADCAYACAGRGLKCGTTIYPLGEVRSPAATAFIASMAAAGRAVSALGKARVEGGQDLHMSLNYLCCYSPTTLEAIYRVLRRLPWPPLNVTFDRPVVRIDGDDSDAPTVANAEHASIVVLLDAPSQRRMERFVAGVEAAIRAAGFDVHVPRAAQEPFHSTLAVVSGGAYPAAAALEAINAAVPPGSWTGQQPFTLPPPDIG